MAPGIINHMHIAQKFEALLEIYRCPDGRKWSGQEIDEATGGVREAALTSPTCARAG